LQPGSGSRSEIALAWFWVAAWIAVVQTFATDSFSAHETSRIIAPILRWLFPDIDARSISTAHFAIRKAAHVITYATLALLALRAFRLTLDRSLVWLAAASLALALAVAVVDEGRQSTLKNRTGAVSDVVLDMSGAAAALVLVTVTRRFREVRT